MKIWALIGDTFREALARRIFWAFFFASTALLLFFIFVMRIDVVEGLVATVTIFGRTNNRSMNVNDMVRNAQGGLATFLYTVGMGLAIFASAGLISAVFEPGRVELLLSKPVPRHNILIGRYLGNLLIVAANLVYLVLGFWLIFGIKTGVWRPHLLLAAVVTLFVFAVLLAFILLTGVVWESGAVSILATFALVVICAVLGARGTFERLLSSEVSREFVRGAYYLLPKIPDLATMMTNIIRGQPITSWMPLWSTAIFGVVTLGSGLWLFSRRDF